MDEKKKNIIEVKNVSIEFPGVKALNDVNFSMESGDVRAVVGANGAGKSTLMKVLAGANPTYTGNVFFNGEKVEIRNPKAAKQIGIEIVYQEVDTALFPAQSVAENIMMNHMISNMKGKVFINWNKINSKAQKVLDRLNLKISPTTLVSNLSLAQKQMILIARAVSEECKFLILDEPTAPLSDNETKELFKIVNDLVKTEGIGIVFISHRLEEVLAICKTVTIMRNGEIVENLDVTPKLTLKRIIDSMLGRSFDENFPRVELDPKEVVFEAKNINDGTMLKDVSMNVRKGEIVGITGLVGAGKTELCKALFGARKLTSGQLYLNGNKINISTPTKAVKNKIGLVPEERRKEGVLVGEPVYSNLSAACLGKFTQNGFVNRKKENQNADKLVSDLGIITPSIFQSVKYLSGGNQQKVSVGKWLAADCEVYIFDEPTKGIDVGAKADVFKLIQNIALSGKSVLYATSETSEILSITNRMYVMYNGQISAELITDDTDEKEIMYYSTGGKNKYVQSEGKA